jgi:hypothetical protein
MSSKMKAGVVPGGAERLSQRRAFASTPILSGLLNQSTLTSSLFQNLAMAVAQATLTVRFETPPRRFLNDTVSPNFTHRRVVR